MSFSIAIAAEENSRKNISFHNWRTGSIIESRYESGESSFFFFSFRVRPKFICWNIGMQLRVTVYGEGEEAVIMDEVARVHRERPGRKSGRKQAMCKICKFLIGSARGRPRVK